MKRGRPIVLCLLLGALLVLIPSCGKKGPPIKPAPRLPAAPAEFFARQRGESVELSARIKLVGLRGRSVRPPLRASLLYIVVPGSANANGWLRGSRDREFLRTAIERELGELDESLVGETIDWKETIQLSEIAPSGTLVLGLALRDRWGRSMPSSRVILQAQRPALEALRAFEARAENDAIVLSWEGAGDAATHVRLYKRPAKSPAPWKAWKMAPLDAGEFRDEEVAYGQDFVYAASASLADAGTSMAPIESALTEEVKVEYRDVFPPRPPEAVDAVSIQQRIRVLWNPGRSPDERLALVERQREGLSGWVEIGRVELPETYLVDTDVTLGQRYRYRVTAIDAAGNGGEPAGPTPWVEPRPPRGERSAP